MLTVEDHSSTSLMSELYALKDHWAAGAWDNISHPSSNAQSSHASYSEATRGASDMAISLVRLMFS